MKKITVMVVVMILITGLTMINPSISYGSAFGRGNGDYRHFAVNNYGHRDWQHSRAYNNVRYARSRYNNNGLYIAGAALGGIILGSVLAGAISQPGYAATRPFCNTPPSGSQAYAQPYGNGSSYNQDTPPGQWVTVQGQWVNSQWVPAHDVWMPVNP